MVHYKLWYFEYRGAAEVIRQLFAVAGQEFEDYRIPLEQWAEVKKTTPFGHIPFLEVDGKPLLQTHAIARYVARKFGLNGKNEWDEAKVNEAADMFNDYVNCTRPYITAVLGYTEGDIEKMQKELVVPSFKKYFGYFAKLLKENKSGYLVGDSLTYVDLLIAGFTDDWTKKDPELFSAFPELTVHQKKIHSDPRLKDWLATRPDVPY